MVARAHRHTCAAVCGTRPGKPAMPGVIHRGGPCPPIANIPARRVVWCTATACMCVCAPVRAHAHLCARVHVRVRGMCARTCVRGRASARMRGDMCARVRAHRSLCARARKRVRAHTCSHMRPHSCGTTTSRPTAPWRRGVLARHCHMPCGDAVALASPCGSSLPCCTAPGPSECGGAGPYGCPFVSGCP